MAVPPFRADGWLPEGHHEVNWDEISSQLDGPPDSQRRRVKESLFAWRDAAWLKSLSGRIILDGSFVSANPNPGDFDLIFVYDADTESIVARDVEAKTLIDSTQCRIRFGGDIFAFAASMVTAYPQYFPLDTYDRVKFTNTVKGVLEVDL